MARSRRRGGRGRRKIARPQADAPAPKRSFWSWLGRLFKPAPRERSREQALGAQEARVLAEFCSQYGIPFRDLTLLKLALTHRSYLSVTGQGPRESNERLEFLGDSVLGLVTSEFLYRRHPDEHEGQLTKTKSLLVSKAILSRRALRMGLGRFVLMSHSEVESGGRQRLSILADAFESVLGAIYLDQGFESARTFITRHLLSDSDAITSDKRHTNYKSHLQEYVQNSFRTHPVYRIRSEYGPDHSKHFMVEVMVGRRTLGEGRGHNKKEAEQAAARDALEKVERMRRTVREESDRDETDHDDSPALTPAPGRARRRGRDDAPPRKPAPEPVLRRPEADEYDEADEFEPPRSHSRRERGERPERPERTERLEHRAPSESIRPRPASEPEPPIRTGDAPESEDDDTPGRRRRRSRRGGRGRHGGARRELAPPPASAAPPARAWDDDDEDDAGIREDSRAPAGSRGASRDAEREPEPEFDRLAGHEFADEPTDSPEAEPARGSRTESKSRATSRSSEISFGRGRRKPGAPPPAAGVESEEPSEERRLDPYDPGDPGAAGSVPVVDVAAVESVEPVESDREREARIEEMERALDSFGRRRPPDYGRRGRRR